MVKMVLIGGGSFAWTPKLAQDLFLRKGLDGSRLVLVDIDAGAAETMCSYCRMLNDFLKREWTVETSLLDDALRDADYVCISISTGGLMAMDMDYRIPEKFGIYHTVGDTTGPGGIFRALRNIPVFIDIAKKMEILCPDAWLLHVTNPLSQLTQAVVESTSIKTAGLCHNFYGTMAFWADFFEAERSEVDALCTGINHNIWLKNLTCAGKPVSQDVLDLDSYNAYAERTGGQLDTNTTDDEIERMNKVPKARFYLNTELYCRFGFFPAGGCAHVAENFPFYTRDHATISKHKIHRKGVLPARRIWQENNRKRIEDIVAGTEPIESVASGKLSDEALSLIVEALHTGQTARAIVAMPNKGQVTNLPTGAIVETWAMVSGSGITPLQSGNVPDAVSGYILNMLKEQELTLKAAVSGNRELVVQALALSPMLTNKDVVEDLAEEMFESQKNYLPQFYSEDNK